MLTHNDASLDLSLRFFRCRRIACARTDAKYTPAVSRLGNSQDEKRGLRPSAAIGSRLSHLRGARRPIRAAAAMPPQSRSGLDTSCLPGASTSGCTRCGGGGIRIGDVEQVGDAAAESRAPSRWPEAGARIRRATVADANPLAKVREIIGSCLRLVAARPSGRDRSRARAS